MGSQPNLIHILPSNRWRGIESYALDICRHFRDLGWNVSAVTRDARAVDALFEKEGFELVHAPLLGMFDYRSVKAIASLLKKNKEEKAIIHVHGFRQACTALIARRISGNSNVRIVLTRHKVKSGVDTWLFKKIYAHVDDIIFVSDLSKKKFLSTWYGRQRPFKEESLHVLRNSINRNITSFKPREAKGPVIGMFHGPLEPGKGLEILIDALKLLKNVKMRLRITGAGKPDYVDKIRRRAQARGVMEMIDWHKHVDDPLPLIEDCDLGILPSQVSEAFGLSNIEYMAVGRPLITTSNGAQTEYLTDGKEGFLVMPGDAVKLAEAIEKLVSNADLRYSMGLAAFNKFNSTLAWQQFAERLQKIYDP